MCKKKCDYIICGFIAILCVALLAFSVSCLIKSYETKDLWDISLWLFALLGLLITVSAAIPAITAIFSYQSFIRNSEQAKNELTDIKNRQQELRQKIENSLPNWKQKFDAIKKLLRNDAEEKWAYEWSRKGTNLSSQEKRDERFYATDCLKPYGGSIYQFIAIKQQQIDQYEGEIGQSEAEHGEVRICNYEARLERLHQELAELYYIASLVDDDFKSLYLKQLITVLMVLDNVRENLQKKEIEKETYLKTQMKSVLLRCIQFNENNFSSIRLSEYERERLYRIAKELLSKQEIDDLINPYKSSEIKLSEHIKKQII